MQPTVCIKCQNMVCNNTQPSTFDICQYGVAYYNDGKFIIRRDGLVPLSLISKNLRHELHRLLAIITRNAVIIDPSISTNQIDTTNPASRIVGTTLIIDHFIQMITGVNEFHTTEPKKQKLTNTSLLNVINNSYSIYSLISNKKRAKKLKLVTEFPNNLFLPKFSDILKYIIFILMDNAWKYSISETNIIISSRMIDKHLCDIIFENISNPIPPNVDIFSKSVQVDSKSEGFGYGLYWANILIGHSNNTMNSLMQLKHDEIFVDQNTAKQQFTIKNVIYNLDKK